jgi:hypothetical protein
MHPAQNQCRRAVVEVIRRNHPTFERFIRRALAPFLCRDKSGIRTQTRLGFWGAVNELRTDRLQSLVIGKFSRLERIRNLPKIPFSRNFEISAKLLRNKSFWLP